MNNVKLIIENLSAGCLADAELRVWKSEKIIDA